MQSFFPIFFPIYLRRQCLEHHTSFWALQFVEDMEWMEKAMREATRRGWETQPVYVDGTNCSSQTLRGENEQRQLFPKKKKKSVTMERMNCSPCSRTYFSPIHQWTFKDIKKIKILTLE